MSRIARCTRLPFSTSLYTQEFCGTNRHDLDGLLQILQREVLVMVVHLLDVCTERTV